MTVKRKNVVRGRQYEKQAAAFYEQKGFEVVALNWQAGHKEIDLIVKKENLLVFVEVKSSSSTEYGHPSEKVTPKKIEFLAQAARLYLEQHQISGCDLRFDVVTFVGGNLEHFPNAFEII